MSDKPKNLTDIDNFWDLDSLLPKKRPVTPSYRQPNTDTVELTIGDDTSPKSNGAPVPPQSEMHYHVNGSKPLSAHEAARRLNELSMRERAESYRSKPLDPYLIYEPESRLIKRVEVSKWESKFNFYENFRTDAKRLWSREGTKCERASFFSYVPQYSQLKYSQMKWYLWWRENVRSGVWLRTDFCYILLYIYEILNCPDMISPEDGLNALCDIWLNYRTEHRRIDSYLCDWLCDYCLINKLPCPTKKLEPILGEIVSIANFREFYMDTGDTHSAAANILSYSSTYDWRGSRYVTEENIHIFAEHIRGAFDKVWHEVLSQGNDGNAAVCREFRIERTAYEGALCVYDMKRTLVIEYISYTRSPKFRFIVTDIIKYSENRIRMALGIKSRLKADELSDKVKQCIDEYFDKNLPAPKKSRQTKPQYAEVNEYDKLYEPETREFSLENALKIEQSSWSTTEILTAAFTDEVPEPIEDSPVEIVPTAPEPDGEDEFENFTKSLDTEAREALTLLINGNESGISEAAKKLGILADALADKINEAAYDIIGDTVIEETDIGYRIINDYKGDLEKWLK
ncbi:MAG: TerB N-terminal domain-containing protein [Clostridia bacterium]|nr:TerB N-terminal domain-containing protein [Clostridia bacterium]